MIDQISTISGNHVHYAMTTRSPLPEDPEEAADALLAQHLLLGSDSGVYSQTQLNRKIREEHKRLPVLEETGLCRETVDALLELRVDELVDAAGLTAIQEIIYRLHVAGFDPSGMAKLLGIGCGLLKRRLRIIEHKVRTAHSEGPYAGWYEVYLSEVSRR